MMRRTLLLLGAVALLCAPAVGQAQIPAAAPWRTIESAHFRITYTPPLEPLARHAAAAAERARALLLEYVADAPDGRVDIVLSDNVDFSNGSATPLPSNRVYLYAKPPVDMVELSYVHDWIEFVVVHELAHIFHLDVTSRFGGVLRNVFGRVPFTWPFFPAADAPSWSTEGLAVAAESRLTLTGRLHGSYHEMVARTAALEAGIDDIDRLGTNSPVWPGGQRVYIYGSLFMHDLEEQYGEDAIARIVRSTASAGIPLWLSFDRVGRRALGVGFRRAYDDWRARATERYHRQADSIASLGGTRATALTRHGGVAWTPRYSPDGSRIAYTASDRRSSSRVRVIDARSGTLAWERRLDGTGVADWIDNDVLIAAQLQFAGPEHIYSDLHRMSRSDDDRLTDGARLHDVSVARTGRVAAVQYLEGTNRLVLLAADGSGLSVLRAHDPRVHWALPRWSPDGRYLAAARWRTGGVFDVVIIDVQSGAEERIGGGGVNGAPAWSPDGRFVVFSSDRDGIPNLYAWDRERAQLARITRVLTGAFFPDVAPDGSAIAYSAYHHDGYHIEVIPVDFTTLTAVAVPDPEPNLTQPPITVVAADTLSGAVRPYRALRSLAPHFWAPILASSGERAFLGIGSLGTDLVGRHAWSASLALAPEGGRSMGELSYQYRGLPNLGSIKPALTLSMLREWDRILEPVRHGDPSIDEREDLVSLGASFTRPRFRYAVSLGAAGELVRRRRLLGDAPGFRLRDPDDDLLGARAFAAFNSARSYPFSISPENGISAQLSGRQRWDRTPRTFTDTAGHVFDYDGSYREAAAWLAGYRALGRINFARAVLGVRASALVRDGIGASPHAVGGNSGERLQLATVDAGGDEFLPVRGFESGARRGTRAWSASAELRAPLALLTYKPHPLPIFFDRLSAAAFVDAGDASCAPEHNCASARLGETLLSAGAEAVFDTFVLGYAARMRLGWAQPLQGDRRQQGVYFALGSSF